MKLSAVVRAEVVQRAGGLCEGTRPSGGRCFGGQGLELHHIIPKRMGGRKGQMAKILDQAWNLMLVCRDCHARCQGTYKLTAIDRELIQSKATESRGAYGGR